MGVVGEKLDQDGDRKAKLAALRKKLNDSIAEGGGYSDDEVAALIEADMAELAKAGL